MEPLMRTDETRAGAATTEQLLDLQQVQELREVLEDEFSSVIEAYLRDAERKVERVVAAADEQDAEALRMAAHSLKGSCRNVGARQLAETCQVIESLAYEERLDNVPGALLALQHSLVATRSAFLGCH
jgi:HPt (histidine-containing phosphotransfer) domain-containing protein